MSMMTDRQWKKYWDGLSIWGKIFHWIKVIAAVLASVAMLAVAAYVVLVVFGVYGFLLKFRDMVLLDLAHWLFG